MTNDADILIEFQDEVQITFDNFTVYYNRTYDDWYAECEESEFYEQIDIKEFEKQDFITLFKTHKLTLAEFKELQLLI